MNKFRALVTFLSQAKIIAIFTCLYLIFILMVMPNVDGKLQEIQVIDLAFAYSSDEVYTWIESYGDAGRAAYIKGELSKDIIYPIIYTALFIGLLGFFSDFKLHPSLKGKRLLILSPLVILTFDLFENIGIVIMLSFYPNQLPIVAFLSSCFTSIKWSAASFVILLTIFKAGLFLASKLKPTLASKP